MESSPHFSNSSDPQNELSSHLSVDYDFSQENLDDIPHPDDNSPPPRPNPLTMILSPNDSELPPLPPDILDDKPPLLSSSQLKNVTLPLCTATIFVPPEQIPLPESSSYQLDSILPPPFTPPLPRCIQNQEENYQSCEKKGNFSSANRNQDDRSQEIGFDANTFLDNAK